MKSIIFSYLLLASNFADAQTSINQKTIKVDSVNDCYKFTILAFEDTIENAYTLFTGNTAANRMILNITEEDIKNDQCTDNLSNRIWYLDKYLQTADSLKEAFKKISLIYVHIDSISQPGIYKEIIRESNSTAYWSPGEVVEEKKNPKLPFQNNYYNELKRFLTKSNLFMPLKMLFEKYLKRKIIFDFVILDESTFIRTEKLDGLNKSLKLTKSLYSKNMSFYIIVK